MWHYCHCHARHTLVTRHTAWCRDQRAGGAGRLQITDHSCRGERRGILIRNLSFSAPQHCHRHHIPSSSKLNITWYTAWCEGQNVNIINYVVLKAVNSEVKNSLNCEWVFFHNLANTMQWKAWKIMSIVSFIKSYETGVSESFISRHKIFIEVFRAVGLTLHNAATA